MEYIGAGAVLDIDYKASLNIVFPSPQWYDKYMRIIFAGNR
jgi:hypothetical protein